MSNTTLKQYLIALGLKDDELVYKALTHRSVGAKNNERLEFLGDSILGFVIAQDLYERMPEADEGDLSRMRASLVNKNALAGIAKRLNLSELITLGEGELKSGGFRRDSILADAVEAIIAAVYLTKGFSQVQEFVLSIYKDSLDNLPDPETLKDPKSRLQEFLQGRNLELPGYDLVSVEGKQHQQQFTASCEIKSYAVKVLGVDSSRRKAEQQAAEQALVEIMKINDQ